MFIYMFLKMQWPQCLDPNHKWHWNSLQRLLRRQSWQRFIFNFFPCRVNSILVSYNNTICIAFESIGPGIACFLFIPRGTGNSYVSLYTLDLEYFLSCNTCLWGTKAIATCLYPVGQSHPKESPCLLGSLEGWSLPGERNWPFLGGVGSPASSSPSSSSFLLWLGPPAWMREREELKGQNSKALQ